MLLVDQATTHTEGPEAVSVGRTAEAGDAYRSALALIHDDAERRLLERRLADLSSAGGEP